jgi:hypothetical protein
MGEHELPSASRCAAVVLTLVMTTLVTSLAAAASPRVLITQQVNDKNLVVLHGNTRPELSASTDRGAVPDGFALNHLWLLLRRPADRQRALQSLLDQQQDPASPNFHHWLSAQQFGEQFGPAQQDIDTVSAWLKAHGFSVNLVYPSRMVIDFSGTAAQLRAAFHTQIHYLVANGRRHIANSSDPAIPAAIAPAVVGLVSLNDFRPQPMLQQRVGYTAGNNYYPVVPADLATIYNLNPLFSAGLSGQNQTVYLLEDSDLYTTADWTTFRSTFGLDSQFPAGSLTQIHPQPAAGGPNCTDPGAGAAAVEATLDAEWASATAPNAAIIVASCADNSQVTNPGVFFALQNLLNNGGPLPAIISISYGASETVSGATYNAYLDSLYQQADAEGASIFVSSGDAGAAVTDSSLGNNTVAKNGISVSSFASTPYDVAVGGTDFEDTYLRQASTYWSSTNGTTFGSALSYIPEIPWNDSCASQLVAQYLSGSSITYGASGFCNNIPSKYATLLLNIVAGSGGPSECATGTPSIPYQISGTCAGYPKPTWQSVLGNPADGVRDVPDVSLFASNGIWAHYYVICYSNTADQGASCAGAPSTWAGAGGTSFAAPIMAAIQALIDQKAGGAQGNPNPRLYELARQEYGGSGSSACNASLGNKIASNCIFDDLTQGDNDVPCSSGPDCYIPSGTYGVLSTSTAAYAPAYNTTVGWDFGSGIGSPNAYNLVMAFAGAPTATPTPAPSATPSGPPTNTATPGPTSGATPTPSAAATPTPQPGSLLGTISAPAPVNVSGTAGQTIGAGSFSYTNRTTAAQQLGAVTVTVSAPAALASLALSAGGQSVTVLPVTNNNVFNFSPPLTVAAGTTLSFALTTRIADQIASESQPIGRAAMFPPMRGALTPAAGMLMLGLMLMPITRRRRWLMALAAVGVVVTVGVAGCGSSSSSSSPVAPSSVTVAITGSGPLSTPVTLSTITATAGGSARSVQQVSAVQFL